MLQDVCVFGNCLPGFVRMAISREKFERIGGEAKIRSTVLGGQKYAIREEYWIAEHAKDDYDTWIRTQV